MKNYIASHSFCGRACAHGDQALPWLSPSPVHWKFSYWAKIKNYQIESQLSTFYPSVGIETVRKAQFFNNSFPLVEAKRMCIADTCKRKQNRWRDQNQRRDEKLSNHLGIMHNFRFTLSHILYQIDRHITDQLKMVYQNQRKLLLIYANARPNHKNMILLKCYGGWLFRFWFRFFSLLIAHNSKLTP